MTAQPRSPGEYSSALRHFADLREREKSDPRINPDCASTLLTHGQRQPRAIVLLHGITSSPPQFADLGQRFFERGYNVLIPRMPLHGFRDRQTTAHARLTAHDLIRYTQEAIGIGRGLGDHLSLAGLSVSGTCAAWAAQNHPDLDRVLLLAPAFTPRGVPLPLGRPLINLVTALPNLFVYWNLRHGANYGPPCGYPRFSTHAMAASFGLGLDIYDQATTTPPRTRDILCVVNQFDPGVDNHATARVMKAWQEHGANVRAFAFRGEVGLLHDFIGPYQPGARPDLVYPLLVNLVDQSA